MNAFDRWEAALERDHPAWYAVLEFAVACAVFALVFFGLPILLGQ